MDKLEITFVDSISTIGCAPWNDLVGTENPFTRYEFLHALEQTGCTTGETGWQPQHVAVYETSHETSHEPSNLVAIVPLFLKSNSWGEYVFDWSWANAYKSYGFEYYPKFVTAAPFTPSFGKRFFIRNDVNKQDLLKLVCEKIKEKAEFFGASSWHILFPTEDEHRSLEEIGIASRIATQFHWKNKGYECFDDFLGALTSRKRKNIRKERQQVYQQDVTFRRTEGADITEEQWSNFYLFYQSTYAMRGMQGYLKQDFFRMVAETMPEQLLMINATQDNRDIAAALFFKNSEKLFGRYWGSAKDYQFLHFETCFYQGQDYAIEHDLKSFDSGAQGEHKIQRGFEPILTYSNHWLAKPEFEDAIRNFLKEEETHIKRYMEDAQSLLPFKQS